MSIFDEIIAKYDIVPYRYYKLERLHSVMADLGLVNPSRVLFNINFVARRTKQNRLELPPKQPGGNRLITGAQIVEIVKAFSPGGIGSWSWRDNIEVKKHFIQSISSESEPGTKEENDGEYSRHKEELREEAKEMQEVHNVQNNIEDSNTNGSFVVQPIS